MLTYPRRYIAILAILLCTLACASQPLPMPTATPTIQPAENPQVVEVTAHAVNIRYLDGRVTGEYALQADRLYGQIKGDWFILESMGIAWGKVWIGCTDAETERECRSK